MESIFSAGWHSVGSGDGGYRAAIPEEEDGRAIGTQIGTPIGESHRMRNAIHARRWNHTPEEDERTRFSWEECCENVVALKRKNVLGWSWCGVPGWVRWNQDTARVLSAKIVCVHVVLKVQMMSFCHLELLYS